MWIQKSTTPFACDVSDGGGGGGVRGICGDAYDALGACGGFGSGEIVVYWENDFENEILWSLWETSIFVGLEIETQTCGHFWTSTWIFELQETSTSSVTSISISWSDSFSGCEILIFGWEIASSLTKTPTPWISTGFPHLM
jgi:hypothetical protein